MVRHTLWSGPIVRKCKIPEHFRIAGPFENIVLLDPRGMGWTAAPSGDKKPESPFGRDWANAFLAFRRPASAR